LLLSVLVTTGNVQDRPGGKQLLTRLYKRLHLPRLKLLWADAFYCGQPFIDWVKATFGWFGKLLGANDDRKGFHVLPCRWAVERTFG
jgi:putative transposase